MILLAAGAIVNQGLISAAMDDTHVITGGFDHLARVHSRPPEHVQPMRLSAEQVEEWYSPCEDGGEDFHLAWAEYKSELRMSNPERYF